MDINEYPRCLKCQAWNRFAIENGFAGGICEECFNKSYVNVRTEWGGTMRCFNSDGEVINCADDLNRKEREKIEMGIEPT